MADSKKYNGSTWEHSLRKLGASTDTITTLPADLYADGNNATVGLVGNMSQTGTPTPQNPIQPSECGDKTANLLSVPDFTILANISNYSVELYNDTLPAGQYTLSLYQNDVLTSSVRNTLRVYANSTVYYENTSENYHNQSGLHFLTFTINEESVARLEMWGHTLSNDCTYSDIMLNTGSTPLPYEPYGYKIPISSANTTTPVYLGEVQTTRKIGKIDLSQVSWTMVASGLWRTMDIPNIKYVSANTELGGGIAEKYTIHTGAGMISALNCIAIDVSQVSVNTGSDTEMPTGMFWYVLANETTGIVNEPIRKIGDYADTISGIIIPTITGKDTFDVLTTLKPSEVSLAYTGWHDATVEEWDGSQWQ